MTGPDPSALPRYGTIQLEVTSRCNLRCRTCLAHDFHHRWRSQDLAPDLFARIEAIADRCDCVHLQGWGESLLRDDLPQLIRRLKTRGCQVSLSSNGTIMTAPLARSLIAAGLDSMAFSLAGSSPAAQDPLRGTGTFDLATAAIRCFIGQRTHRKHPPVLVNYLLTPRNLSELFRAVLLCARLGVDGLKGTHMVHVCTDSQRELVAYRPAGSGGRRFFWPRLMAFFLGLPLVLPPMEKQLVPICDKNPLRNLFVGSDGSVAPCVSLNPPLTGSCPVWRRGQYAETWPCILGNLAQNTLDEIWSTPAYADFRRLLQQRVHLYSSLLSGISADSDGALRLERSLAVIEQQFAADLPPPPPCYDCPQMHGL